MFLPLSQYLRFANLKLFKYFSVSYIGSSVRMGGLPDRWMDYKPMGRVIPGTRFIAFKVPLKEALCKGLKKNQRFTPQDIIDEKPNISLIVDLTNTTRYYDKDVFQNANVSYVKIYCPGLVIPTKEIIAEFFGSVDKFLSEHPNDETLIGVHCTHGVNRTGYFICKYMIDKMGIDPSLAIEDVGRARGHPIERINYLEDLKGEKSTGMPSPVKPDQRESNVRENWRDTARRNVDGCERSYNSRNSYSERNSYNERKSYNERNSFSERNPDRSNWRRDDTRRNSRSNNRHQPYGDRPRYGRQSRDFQRSPRGSGRGSNTGRRNWNERSRPQYEQGPSRNFSSERYQQNGRSRSRPIYEDRPNRNPR